jgi:hypothetical protein
VLLQPADAGFCVTPSAGVLFDTYEAGEVCYAAVLLQNVGGISRQLRLLPPSSRYFQTSLPRCGVVALRVCTAQQQRALLSAAPVSLTKLAASPGVPRRFPLEASTLAPGMAAEVNVCFMPDSLGGYEDAFTVDSPGGRFEVPLVGRRPAPALSLPLVLQVRAPATVPSMGRTRGCLPTAACPQQWALLQALD